MNLRRLLKHLLYPDWMVRRAFPAPVMARIEAAIAASEAKHRGELRFAVEASLDLRVLLAGQGARERAIDVFSALRVWDTEENNGVLIYLLLADHDVEIVADRGVSRALPQDFWGEVCRTMEAHFRAGRYADGVLAGVQAIGDQLTALYPRTGADVNELPNEPVRL